MKIKSASIWHRVTLLLAIAAHLYSTFPSTAGTVRTKTVTDPVTGGSTQVTEIETDTETITVTTITGAADIDPALVAQADGVLHLNARPNATEAELTAMAISAARQMSLNPDMGLNPGSAHPQLIAQCVIAVLVIVVGGIVIYKIVKLCKKCLNPPPPPTNAPPRGNNVVAGSGLKTTHINGDTATVSALTQAQADTNVYMMLIPIGNAHPSTVQDNDGDSLTIPYTITLASNQASLALGNPICQKASAQIDATNFVTWLYNHGLDTNGYSGGGPAMTASYSKNGVPTPITNFPAYVPRVSISPSGAIMLTNNSLNSYAVIMNRKGSLEDPEWVPASTNISPADLTIYMMIDNVSSNQFYRAMLPGMSGANQVFP